MKKLIIGIAVLCLACVVPVYADSGGEGNNTGCNGVGNENSPCAGQGGNGGNGGNGGKGGSVKSKIKNINKNTNTNSISNKINNTISNKVNNKANANATANNKNSNSQEQSATANNEGVTVEGDSNSYEDNSVFLAPPPTTPLVGTTSVQVTTPFGGAGFSKDAKHAKLMTTIQFIDYMRDQKLLDEDKAKADALKVYNKLLKTVCGRSCTKKDDTDDDSGNGGNL